MSYASNKSSYWEHIWLVFATVLFLLAYELLPERKMALIPANDGDFSIYSDMLDGRLSQATWSLEQGKQMTCEVIETDQDSYCGIVHIGWSDTKGFSLADFDTVFVELETEGEPDEVRVYVRNYNPDYSEYGKAQTYLYNYVVLDKSELNGSIKIGMEEFRVADWWVDRYKPPRRYQTPQFDSVVYIGFDLKTRSPGKYALHIKSMTFFGEMVQRSNWYLIALIFVVLAVIFQAVRTAFKARSQSKKDREMMQQMAVIQNTLIHQNEEIAKLSTVDPLTQVYNRLGFENILEALKKENMPEEGAILVADIDFFKKINDEHGHAVGDKVIVYVASMLCKNVRDSDSVIRWGGEEFLVILPNCHLENTKRIAEKMRASIAEDSPPELEHISVTVSIGGALFKLSDEFDKTFKQADEALYRAKEQGRNMIEIHTER